MSTTVRYIRALGRESDAVGIRIFAASIAFRAIFALLSFLSTFLLILWIFGTDLDSQSGAIIFGLLPQDLADIAADRTARTLLLTDDKVVIAGAAGFAFGLHGLAGAFMAVCDALNRVHGTASYRSLPRRYLRGLLVSLCFVTVITIAVVATVVGTATGLRLLAIAGIEGLDGELATTIRVAVVIGAVLVAAAGLLRYGSDARPMWPTTLLSAVMCAVGWVAVIVAYGIALGPYVRVLELYGAIASAIGILLAGHALSWVLLMSAFLAPHLEKLLRTRNLAA